MKARRQKSLSSNLYLHDRSAVQSFSDIESSYGKFPKVITKSAGRLTKDRGLLFRYHLSWKGFALVKLASIHVQSLCSPAHNLQRTQELHCAPPIRLHKLSSFFLQCHSPGHLLTLLPFVACCHSHFKLAFFAGSCLQTVVFTSTGSA